MSDLTMAAITTDDLRRLIREELGGALDDVPNTDEVNRMIAQALHDHPTFAHVNETIDAKIEAQIEKTFQPVLDEVRKGLAAVSAQIAAIDKRLAVIGNQTANTAETVRNMKDDQDRLDNEHEEDRREISELRNQVTSQAHELGEHKRAVFGEPGKEGAISFLDQMRNGFKELAMQAGVQHRETLTAVQKNTQKIETVEADVQAVKTEVAENTSWRQKRAAVEQMLLRVVKQAPQRLQQAVTDEFVIKWAIRILVSGGVGTAIIKLLENA